MLALMLFLACVDYEINEQPSQPEGSLDTAAPVDTGEPDTTEDTADTGEPLDVGEIAMAPVYANSSDTLYEVEPTRGELTEVGQFHQGSTVVEYFVDIAIDMAGHMYGGTFDALYRIDPETAEVTKLCDTDFDMTALTFTSDGVLIAGGDNAIHRVNLGTCEVEPLVSGSPYSTSGDLVGLPDGYLYWTVWGDGDGDELIRVNPDNGSAAWLGVIGHEKLFGLGYHAGQLYGFSSGGSIVEIDPSDAEGDLICVTHEGWWGATTNPVVW
jgi:hypothetical protein